MAKRESAAGAKRRTVADLVAARAAAAHVERFTPEQLAQLRDVFAHNDGAPLKQRLSSRAVHELLAAEYGFTAGISALERWACEALGRRSWGVK